MPRYKVVLEFDHPGDNMQVEGGFVQSPAKWNWGYILGIDCTNISAEVSVKSEWSHLSHSKYERGKA